METLCINWSNRTIDHDHLYRNCRWFKQQGGPWFEAWSVGIEHDMGQNPCKVMIPPPQRATMSHLPAPKHEIDIQPNCSSQWSQWIECLRGGWGHMFLTSKLSQLHRTKVEITLQGCCFEVSSPCLHGMSIALLHCHSFSSRLQSHIVPR